MRGTSLEGLLHAPLDRAVEYRDVFVSLLSMTNPSEAGYPALKDAAQLFEAVVRESIQGGFTLSARGAAAAAGSPARGGGAAQSSSSSAPFPFSATSGGTFASPSRLAAADVAEASGALTTESVLAAQAEAEAASRRLEALEREVSLKESELALTSREVARAEAERSRLPAPDAGPLEDALAKLADEERELLSRVSSSEHRALFEAFLARKRELEEEEARLGAALEEHEDTLARVRAALANPHPSVLPTDPAKAALYTAWKRALAEREELLRAARRRKHELLRDLKARHETQVVLLEMERRAAVDGVRDAVAAERAKVDAHRRDLAALDDSIEAARAAMAKFRGEFEQLRVALLLDRMAKSTQVANLTERRRRLAREAELFADAVDAAKARVAADEAAKWEAKLEAEKAAGEERIAAEKAAIEEKIEKVRGLLAERYEAGFKPLLAEAEARHVEELNKVVALQRELDAKEVRRREARAASRSAARHSRSRAPCLAITRPPFPSPAGRAARDARVCAVHLRGGGVADVGRGRGRGRGGRARVEAARV